MTTETRSVTEIMGWQYADHLPAHVYEYDGLMNRCAWCDDIEGSTVAARCLDNPVMIEPTPDDMLAWLRERGYLASIIHWRHGFDVVVRKDYRNVQHDTHAPTLHAALEAAVRAVAGEAGG